MNRILSLALAATAFVATPAMAQGAPASSPTFTGPRIGANVGFYNNTAFGFDEFSYGAEVGYDVAVGGAVLGISGEAQKSNEVDRDLSISARAGARVGGSGLLYVTGGYTNVKTYGIKLNGFRLGVGGELAVGKIGFVKLEQRYNRYDYGIHLWQTVVGGGVRF